MSDAAATTPASSQPPTDAQPSAQESVGAAELTSDQLAAVEPASAGATFREQVGEAREKAGQVAGQVAEQLGEAMQQAGAVTTRVAGQVAERLRNNAQLPAERGTTTIAHEVVEKIAGIAARQVPGVYDLGGDVARVFASVKERIGLGESEADQGVSVRLEGRDAIINITIVIEFGFVVYSVTEKVREKVISSVENLLGLEVTEVNIVVDDVHIAEEGPIGDDEARAVGYTAQTTGITVG